MKGYLSALFIFLNLSAFSQIENPSGYFTSECVAIHGNDKLFVSIKKYNPTSEEIKKASKAKPNELMNYLMLPYQATNIGLGNKGFESKLYCLKDDGSTQWEKTIGYSENSEASPVTLNANYIYTGEGQLDKQAIKIYKIDVNGAIKWETTLDSLVNVNSITTQADEVIVLASLNLRKEVPNGNGVSYDIFPVYYFIRLNIETGELLSKQYQLMGTYLSSKGFHQTQVCDTVTYMLANADSLIYLNTLEQRNAKVVIDNFENVKGIKNWSASEGQYSFLTTLETKNSNSYLFCTDNYFLLKSDTANIPLTYNPNASAFIAQKEGVSYICICDDHRINIYKYIDEAIVNIYSGDIVNSSAIGFSVGDTNLFLIQMEGRDIPGKSGILKFTKIPF